MLLWTLKLELKHHRCAKVQNHFFVRKLTHQKWGDIKFKIILSYWASIKLWQLISHRGKAGVGETCAVVCRSEIQRMQYAKMCAQ